MNKKNIIALLEYCKKNNFDVKFVYGSNQLDYIKVKDMQGEEYSYSKDILEGEFLFQPQHTGFSKDELLSHIRILDKLNNLEK